MDTARLVLKMCEYEEGEVKRVNHFLKVYGFAKTIGEGEGLEPARQEILEAAAIVHDIGIKRSLEKYGSSAGPYQEKEGPAIAREMLEGLGYDKALTDRVCYLVGHHHTYGAAIDGPDYQALVEADFLVNIFEGEMEEPAIREVREKVFKTATGLKLLDGLFLRG